MMKQSKRQHVVYLLCLVCLPSSFVPLQLVWTASFPDSSVPHWRPSACFGRLSAKKTSNVTQIYIRGFQCEFPSLSFLKIWNRNCRWKQQLLFTRSNYRAVQLLVWWHCLRMYSTITCMCCEPCIVFASTHDYVNEIFKHFGNHHEISKMLNAKWWMYDRQLGSSHVP